MNEYEVVQSMINFVEAKERAIQSGKLGTPTQSKSDTVKSILDELERVMTDENK